MAAHPYNNLVRTQLGSSYPQAYLSQSFDSIRRIIRQGLQTDQLCLLAIQMIFMLPSSVPFVARGPERTSRRRNQAGCISASFRSDVIRDSVPVGARGCGLHLLLPWNPLSECRVTGPDNLVIFGYGFVLQQVHTFLPPQVGYIIYLP